MSPEHAPNDDNVVLSDVFTAIRKSLDTNENVTASLIAGLFTKEASFDVDTLTYYFKTEAAKRKDLQTTILSNHDEVFADEMRFLRNEADKDKRDRNADEIETVSRRHKSLRNIFHSCMQACYFLRVGGELAGNDIGPAKTIKKVKDRFIISYIDEDDTVTRLQGKYSSAAIIKAGSKATDKLLNKTRTASATSSTSATASPISMVNASVNTFHAMIDTALNEQTEALKKQGQTIERATIDDLPDDVVTNLDNMLVKLLKMKFVHEGKLELVDLEGWLADTMKDVEVSDKKQVRPLKKTA